MQRKLTCKEIFPDADISCIFHINDRVQLKIDGESHASRVEDIGPDHIVVAAPTATLLGVGRKVTVGIVFREVMHEFDCTVKEERSGRVATIVLEDLKHFNVVDRRLYPRTKAKIPVSFRLARAVGPWEASVTDDIGGGGIRVARNDATRLSVGDIVAAKIMLDKKKSIDTICRVLRVSNEPGIGRTWGYWAADFVEIKPDERDKIIHFVKSRLDLLNR